MLDNLLNTVKKGAEKVQRRGEEVAQIARLKMEIFQLGRELDGHYGRLGRAYHDGKDVDILAGIREDIRHTEEEISGRERLITELGDTPDPRPESGSIEKVERAPAPQSPATQSPAASQGANTGAATVQHMTPPSTPTTTGNQPPFTNTEPADKGDLKL